MKSLKVGLTGASGQLGSILKDGFTGECFELRTFHFPNGVDLSDAAALEGAFEGLDVVVHCAGDPSTAAPFADIVKTNLVVTHNVLEECRRARVRRVVLSSSTHTVGDRLGFLHNPSAQASVFGNVFPDGVGPSLTSSDSYDADSHYGLTKAFNELEGRLYARIHGLEVICLRIGWICGEFLAEERERRDWLLHLDENARAYARALLLTRRDAISVFQTAVSAPMDVSASASTTVTAPVPFRLGYAISQGPSASLVHAESLGVFGWTPADNAHCILDSL